jgi:hypothetical protein
VSDEIVATSALLSLRIAIPGAVVPMAGRERPPACMPSTCAAGCSTA